LPDLVRTFTTRVDSHPALNARAELESRIERKLYAALRTGRKFTGDLATNFYQQFGISAKTLDGIHRQLQGKLKSISEPAKNHVSEAEIRIAAKRKTIVSVENAIVAHRRPPKGVGLPGKQPPGEPPPPDPLAMARPRPEKLLRSLHHHKRRLSILESRLAAARKRVDDPRICVGTRKRFNAQHHLEANGFEDHKDWLREWRAVRSAQFFIEGDARALAGNQFARINPRDDGRFDLELRLPETLGIWAEDEVMKNGHVVRSAFFSGLWFEHGGAEIRDALTTKKPLSYRFLRHIDGSWFVSVMLRQDFVEPAVTGFSGGCLGVDLNADHVALTLTDATGNPLMTLKDALGRPVVNRRIDLVTYGKTKAQRLDMIRKAAAEIATLAVQLGVPVAAENLDFKRKRAELETATGKKRARMLSSFAYTSFAQALSRVCIRRSVKLVLVNPAYTSIIGLVKFAPRYGSSVHAAAALAIARRAMALSERLPASGERISVRLASGDLVTLPRPARIARRHVWSSWSQLSRGMSAVHEGHRGARREARSHGAGGLATSRAAATGTGSRHPFSGQG
jgi:IS605 OrfB family transposase